MSEVLQLLAGEGNQSHHSQHSNLLPAGVPDALPSEVAAGIFHSRNIHLTVRQLPPQHLPTPSRRARAFRCSCQRAGPQIPKPQGAGGQHRAVALSMRRQRGLPGEEEPHAVTQPLAPAGPHQRGTAWETRKARPGGRANAGEAAFSHPNCTRTGKFLLAPTPSSGIKTSKPAASRQRVTSGVTASPRQTTLSGSLQCTPLLGGRLRSTAGCTAGCTAGTRKETRD